MSLFCLKQLLQRFQTSPFFMRPENQSVFIIFPPFHSLLIRRYNADCPYYVYSYIQNKMNKIERGRLFKLTKPASGMRMIFKKRNNHKEKAEGLRLASESPTSLSQSTFTPTHFDHYDLKDVRNHVRNHFKTEYHDKYRQFSTHIDCPNTSHSPSNRPMHTHNSSKTVQQPSHQSSRSTPTCSHLKINPNDPPDVSNSSPENQKTKPIHLTLNEIEAGIEESLHKRLKTCLQFNKTGDWQQDLSANSLKKIIADLREATEDQQPQNPEPQNRKINLLQQLMAANTVESQILKNYYFSKLTHKSLQQKNPAQTVEVVDRNINKSPITQRQSFILTSECRQSFQKPSKDAYLKYKHQHGFFSSGKNRQPLPRSSYSRQFLDYRTGVPRLPLSKPRDSAFMNSIGSAKSLQSTYQHCFFAKQADKINIKELDACRNKIKNLQINFGKHQQQPMIDQLNRFFQRKLQPMSQKREETPFLKNSFVSESRRQYKGQKGETGPKIKHKNLERLKQAYKAKINI